MHQRQHADAYPSKPQGCPPHINPRPTSNSSCLECSPRFDHSLAHSLNICYCSVEYSEKSKHPPQNTSHLAPPRGHRGFEIPFQSAKSLCKMAPTIIHSVLLFDGTSVHQDATVSFDSSSGLITSVSKDKSGFPQGATVIDGHGHTLLPGLIESHMHVHGLHLPEGSDENDILRSPLRSGVTTVCDMHSDLGTVNTWRKRIAEEMKQVKAGGGTVSLSDLKTALLGATIAGGWPGPIVLGPNPTDEVC